MWARRVNFSLQSSNLSLEEDALVELVNQPVEVKQRLGQGWIHIQCYYVTWEPGVQICVYNLFIDYC